MKKMVSLKKSFGIFSETYRCLKKSNHPEQDLKSLKLFWAKNILSQLNLELSTEGEVSNDPSILFLGNHLSYIDIPLLMGVIPNCSFVAKQELNSWPIFGSCARKTDTVFVKRNNHDSRQQAKQDIRKAISSGKRIVLFPSGTTCLNESKPWRKGAFEIAQQENCFVQPFRISYTPLRETAFIDNDLFFPHLYKLFSLDSIKAKIEFHAPVKIHDPLESCSYWNHWSRGLLDAYSA